MQASYTWAKTLERVTLLNAQDTKLGDLRSTARRTASDRIRYPAHDLHGWFVRTALRQGPEVPHLNNMGGVANAGLRRLERQRPVHLPFRAADRVPQRGADRGPQRQADLGAARRTRPQGGPERVQSVLRQVFRHVDLPLAAQAPFTLRDFPTRFPDVRSPVLSSWELSAYKNFTLKERLKLQLRADFQNAFDQPYFGRLIANGNNVQDSRFGQLDPAQGNQPRVVVLVMKLLF